MIAVQERLMKFIENQTGFSILPYNSFTKLQDDFGIYGDDASEFLIKFSKEFNVKISNDFNIDKYFDNEGIGLFLFFSRIFSGKNKGLNKKRKSINLGHLEKAIELGRLDENIINDI